MNKHLAPIALSVGLLGMVGGVAATQAFRPADKPAQRQVQLVEPAAETVTPTPTVTVEPAPTVTVTATPKPVQSVKAKAPAPAPVQRQAVVSEPAPEPAPEPAVTPNAPPVKWGPAGPPPNPDSPPAK